MRTVIIGLDAFDPKVFERLAEHGRMPTLDRLAGTGGYSRFGVANPPQSEVSWTSIATGLDPGRHGLFDFVHRDPSDYGLSLSLLPMRSSRWATRFIPPTRATTIFDHAVHQGFPATTMWWPATFPARLESPIRTLPGLGTPDVHGRLGVGSLFTVDDSLHDEPFKTSIEVLDNPSSGLYASTLNGPARQRRAGIETSVAPLRLEIRDEKTARLTVGQTQIDLALGEWSPIVEVEFKIGRLYSVWALTRAIMTQSSPDPRLYFLPLQIHPLKTPWRYAAPRRFVRDVWKSAGPFLTLGWPQDTTALEEGWINDTQFLDLCEAITRTREKILLGQISLMKDGILASVCDTLDRIQHMYWRDRPDLIESWYVKLDRLVGLVDERLRERFAGPTKLVIVSDHGFTKFDHKVHLNRWLLEHGYLGANQGKETGSLEDVQWRASQAYAVGLNSVYLNIEGRERLGWVSVTEREALAGRLRGELIAWKGPDGNSVIREVYRGTDIYSDPPSELAPDLVVGYGSGYRASAETGLGSWKQSSLEANHDHWSGDHCVDPEIVPGVIFCNQGLANVPAPTFRDFPAIVLGTEIDQKFSPPPRMSSEDREVVEERLKGLGYL
jgi:predicted AlkP superfamily phosphohydrolase/phosphomutase